MLKWLVAGIGDITTKRAIPAILAEPRSELHAVLTRNREKAAVYAGAKVYGKLEEALADPEIDAVYVGLPVVMLLSDFQYDYQMSFLANLFTVHCLFLHYDRSF